jgi:hypothetical protein
MLLLCVSVGANLFLVLNLYILLVFCMYLFSLFLLVITILRIEQSCRKQSIIFVLPAKHDNTQADISKMK